MRIQEAIEIDLYSCAECYDDGYSIIVRKEDDGAYTVSFAVGLMPPYEVNQVASLQEAEATASASHAYREEGWYPIDPEEEEEDEEGEPDV